MKKIFLLPLVIAFCIQFLQAQDFRFGFNMAPSLSWITTDDSKINADGSNLGFKILVQGENFFEENYALVAGIGFAFNQGGSLKYDVGGPLWSKSELEDPARDTFANGVTLQYKLEYIEIPLSLKLRTNEFGQIRYFAEAPMFVLGLNTKSRGDVSNNNGFNPEDQNIKENVNFMSISWGIGAGAEYNINDNTTLTAGLYFQKGFIDVTDDEARNFDGEEDSKATIGSLSLRIGVLF